jgi:hypothetical protein
MNFSFIDNYKNNDFVRKSEILYRDENMTNPPLKNYQTSMYEQKYDNWATNNSIQQTMLKSVFTPTPLGEIYFCPENIIRLQKRIKREIFIRSNGKYKLDIDQSESDLLIVMRATYISDSKNAPYKLIHQVKELNHKTIERIVPDMLSMIKQDEEYINQLDKPIIPIALPVNVSRAGRLTLPSVTTTFM